MRQFYRQAVIVSACFLLAFGSVEAKKKNSNTGFEGMKTDPNLTLTLSTGGSKGRTGRSGRSSRSRKSGRRSGRRSGGRSGRGKLKLAL